MDSVARIGLILPSVNVVMEPELNRLGLPGVTFHATRVLLTQTTPEALVAMERDLEYAARLIASVRPKAVAYACTSGSFIKGITWDQNIAKTIERIAGCPAVTTSSAMVDALKTLGAKRVAVATPYIDDINRHEAEFLEANGFEVVGIKGMQIIDADELHAKTPQEIYDLVLEVDNPKADCVFISCTDFRGMEVADSLEKRLSKPVVTSNQATLWRLLKMIGFSEGIGGYGRLLKDFL